MAKAKVIRRRAKSSPPEAVNVFTPGADEENAAIVAGSTRLIDFYCYDCRILTPDVVEDDQGALRCLECAKRLQGSSSPKKSSTDLKRSSKLRPVASSREPK